MIDWNSVFIGGLGALVIVVLTTGAVFLFTWLEQGDREEDEL